MERLTKNEEANESFAVIKTRKYNEDTIEMTIFEQQSIGFSEIRVVVDLDETPTLYDPEVESNDNQKLVIIDSCNVVEYNESTDEKIYQIFMKGDRDYNENAKLLIPERAWPYIKKALEYLGAEIDVEEVEVQENQAEETEKISYDLSFLVPTEEEIKEMISLVDIDTFNKIIKNRLSKEISSSEKELLGQINRKWAREYLRDWAISKYKFYRIFGRKLSVSKEIQTTPDDNSIKEILREIKLTFPLYAPVFENIAIEAFISKKIKNSNASSVFFKDKRVKTGMSITKFISFYGNKDLDTEISKMYQDVGKNTIFLSIDPVDYLTVSINSSGWESCHHFLDGCYRNAGLSYMVDKTTFISFASRKNISYSFEFPYEWNTKNWRQMVYMSEKNSATVFSRQYPYSSDEISKCVRELFEELVSSFFGSKNAWKVYSDCKRTNIDVEKGERSLVYNDIANEYSHKVIRAKDDIGFDSSDSIMIGGKVKTLFDKSLIIPNEKCYLLKGE